MVHYILAINPGSTSTKIALFEDEKEVFSETLDHDVAELAKYDHVQEQFKMRQEVVVEALRRKAFDIQKLSAIVGRGGMLPPVKSGAYRVNDKMVDFLTHRPVLEHASNLGALIAFELAESIGVPSYIYDSVRVDELKPVARISGMPEVPRTSTVHALNARAMAMKAAEENGKQYTQINCIVAHLGGGISLSVHEKGQMVDIVSDDEGPFSPERAGRVPCKSLIDLCFSGKYDHKTLNKMLRGNGGLKAYLNTVDARDVEKMIASGNEEAKVIYEAMAYQVAKGIGEMATVVSGEVDFIVLTGGIAYSKMLTDWIVSRVKFIAPVVLLPGENEMVSLANGALRVLKGVEEARVFDV